jgi:hypothetical protein
LNRACGLHWPLPPVKRETSVFPRQPTMSHDATGLAFEVCDHVFILDLEQEAFWQRGAPVLHQLQISAVITPQLTELVRVGLMAHEQQREAGKAGVDGVTARVNDASPGQRQMNEAE